MPRVTAYRAAPSGLASNSDLKAILGARIRARLDALDMRQSDLARKSGLGRDSISLYVRGLALPTQSSLARLAEALSLRLEDLAPELTEAGQGASVTLSEGQGGLVRLRADVLLTREQAEAVSDLISSFTKA